MCARVCIYVYVFCMSFASTVTTVAILTLAEIKYRALEDSFFEDEELQTY